MLVRFLADVNTELHGKPPTREAPDVYYIGPRPAKSGIIHGQLVECDDNDPWVLGRIAAGVCVRVEKPPDGEKVYKHPYHHYREVILPTLDPGRMERARVAGEAANRKAGVAPSGPVVAEDDGA